MSLNINDLKNGIQDNVLSLKSLVDSLAYHSKKLQNVESHNSVIKINEKNLLAVKNIGLVEIIIRENTLIILEFLKKNEQAIKNGPSKIDLRKYLDIVCMLNDYKNKLDLEKSIVFKNTQLQLVSINLIIF